MSPPAVAVLGCGLIGSSWVECFASAGATVRAWDPQTQTRETLAARGLEAIEVCATPEAAVQGAEFIQESGPETLETKRSLLARIAPHVGPRSIFASSTSTLQATQLQADSSIADRILIGHPFNPPHIIPLVEVVGGPATAPWAIDRAMAFYADMGKRPIRLRLERPGHLANRLQAAVWREAVDAVASGQATVADVDAAVTFALGPRWAIMGPFATFHLGGGGGGLKHFIEHLGLPFEALWDDAHRPEMTPQLKRQLVDAVANAVGNRPVQDLSSERNVRLRHVMAAAHGPLKMTADE